MAAARLYSDDEVGVASAAIAAMMLLSMLAMLGLDYALIRFIPGAGRSARDVINSSFTIGVLASIVLALVFIAGLSLWAPGLHQLLEHPMLFIAFVLSVTATTLSTLAQRVFTAKRRSSFALAIGLVFALLRFVPLPIMAAYSATLGIFSAWVIAASISVIIGILFLLPRVEPGYRPSLVIKKDIVSPMVRFASANFLANVSSTITSGVLPLLVLYVLSEEQTAYFYIAWTFNMVMLAVLSSVTISLFTEGSHDEQGMKEYVKKSLKLMSLILMPAVTLTLLLGDKLLLAFGQAYSENATHLLWLLVLSCVPAGINHTYIAVMRVGGQTRGIVAFTLVTAVLTLASSVYLLSHMGLTGVGVACITSQGIIAIYAGRQILRIYSGA
jgi:O-antigen/teichoic acid export membrane protein